MPEAKQSLYLEQSRISDSTRSDQARKQHRQSYLFMDELRSTGGANDAHLQQQKPLMTSVNDSTEKLCDRLSHDDFPPVTAARAPKQRFLSCLLVALSFCAGVILTTITLSATGLLDQTLLRITDDTRLPTIASGTNQRTGQPASWFNGNCGNSSTQALSRGCVFDLVSHSWLPQDCLSAEDLADAELMYADSTWHWGLDNTTEVSLESVRLGEFDRVWTSMDWHVTHCSYIWKRLHRALLDPKMKLDSYTADYHHTNHCVEMIAGLSPVGPINGTGTRVYTKYPTCS